MKIKYLTTRFIGKWFKSDLLFYSAISIFILLLAQLPVILHIFHTPAGYYFPLIDQTSFSDFYYISVVRFGMGNGWLLKIPYITTPHQASIIQILFVLLGKLSLLTGLGPAETLFIFRILGGILLLISSILLIRLILPKNLQRLTFILFIFTEPFPDFAKTVLKEAYFTWVWHFGDAARRISAGPPHYSIGKGLAVLSLVLLFSYIKTGKKYLPVLFISTVVLSGIIYPPPVFIILISLGICLLIWLLASKFKITKITRYWGFILYFIAGIIPILILKLELAKGYPWNMWNRVELGWNDPYLHIELDYFRMFWWLFLLVPVSIPVIFNNKTSPEKIFLFVWAVSGFFLFPFANVMSVGKFRFTEGWQILPLSAIGAITLINYRELLRKRLNRILVTGLKWTAVILLSGYFILFAGLVLRETVLRLWPFWRNVYFHPHDLESFRYLDKDVPEGAIVYTDAFPANYLPAFAKVRTFLGFSDFYPKFIDYQHDLKDAEAILQNKSGKIETLKILKAKQADYIYIDKSVYGSHELDEEFAEKVFDNPKIRIYKVKSGAL